MKLTLRAFIKKAKNLYNSRKRSFRSFREALDIYVLAAKTDEFVLAYSIK